MTALSHPFRPLSGFLLMLAGSGALFLAAQPAEAASVRPVRVVIAADDLASAKGRIAVNHRIERAASRACGIGDVADRRSAAKKSECAQQVSGRIRMELAMRRYGRPQLAEVSVNPSVVSPAEVRL